MVGQNETAPAPPAEWRFAHSFDGEEKGCGELLIDLRLFFRALPGGTDVLVTARDPGAPVEMPAWCRMTRHKLIGSAHPHYLVQTRET